MVATTSNGADCPPIHLILFFTRGVSLRSWANWGMLEREVAIYRQLQKHDIQISFVTYGDGRDLQYADRIPGVRILCNHWGLPGRLYEALLPFLHGRYLRRADVYKTNQTDGADVALQAARLFRKPLIARCGYIWSCFAIRREGENSETARNARRSEREVFKAADRIVVTAGHMKQYVEEQYSIESDRVTVIPNYVLTDLFRPDSQIACKPDRICFVGRLFPQKNLLALLEAAQGLNIELEIIGDGPQRETLEATAHEKGLNALFLGNRPHTELPEHFNAAEVVILPSLYEGHPKTLLEAMACGRPVIGTDAPGIRELIHHRETGYLCGTSSEEIRAAIQDVLSNKDLRVDMGRRARDFVAEHFSLDRVIQKEMALLREVGELTTGRGRLESAVEMLSILKVISHQAARAFLRRARQSMKHVLSRAAE